MAKVSKKVEQPEPGVKKPSRKIPPTTRLFLYVRAGGRCEFDGCNRYLLEHHVTKAEGNFAEMAHIWAFSDGGPRANKEATDIHDISNLMLLCPECHKHVDDRPEEFSADVLRSHKKAHEDRVFQLTDTKPDRDTVAVVLRSKIAGKPVTITLAEVQRAIAPRYCSDRCLFDIDLTAFNDDPTEAYWNAASSEIRSRLRSFYDTRFDGKTAHHVSVFGLAPIPLLMVLGSLLSDKVPTTLYQRHRSGENWEWKDEGVEAEFTTEILREGADHKKVALLVSLSGLISLENLPSHVDKTYSVYHVVPTNVKPDRGILDLEASLEAFRTEYQRTMRLLVERHPEIQSVDVFPAVPAPAAVAMGRDLLPKRDPVLVVFDFNKAVGGFVRTLEINANDS